MTHLQDLNSHQPLASNVKHTVRCTHVLTHTHTRTLTHSHTHTDPFYMRHQTLGDSLRDSKRQKKKSGTGREGRRMTQPSEYCTRILLWIQSTNVKNKAGPQHSGFKTLTNPHPVTTLGPQEPTFIFLHS